MELKAQFTAYTSPRQAYTANGTKPNEYTCAGPKEIPFGTKIKVSGTGTKYDGRTYTVTDRGGAVKIVNGRYIFDLWIPTEMECKLFGRRNGTATIITESKVSEPKTELRLDIVDIARKEIGVSETNKGHMKYINWFGGFTYTTPWCAIFVAWCANQAKVSTSIIPKNASCLASKHWFEGKGLFKQKGFYVPQRGDIIFFFNNKGRRHTGIVEYSANGKVYTIEGNTSGHAVARREHSLTETDIAGYGTPQYDYLNSSNVSSSSGGGGGTGGNTGISKPQKKKKRNESKEDKKERARQELAMLKLMTSQVATPIKDVTNYGIAYTKLDTNVVLKVVIQSNRKKFVVPVEEGAELKWERSGQPGTFTFTTIPKKGYGFSEGNAVLVILNKKKIFYGFIFRKQRTKTGLIKVTVYDQIRYLKNEDIIIYSKKTTAELIQMIAKAYKLKTGELANTGYKMSRVEDVVELYEMVQTSLNETVLHTGKTFIFYDEVGKLTLKNIDSMRVNWVISKDTAEDMDYESSIDQDFYNQVKVIYKDDETGVADIYVAKSNGSQNKFGVLQTTDEIPFNLYELGKLKAKALLDYYNRKHRTLSVTGAIGNIEVRGGTLLPVILELGDMKVQNYMMVEKVSHKFYNQVHKMDLVLVGGDFVG